MDSLSEGGGREGWAGGEGRGGDFLPKFHDIKVLFY